MLEKIIKTVLLVLFYCFIWTGLEKMMYGEIQPRTVDDIIMLLLIPIFYRAVANS